MKLPSWLRDCCARLSACFTLGLLSSLPLVGAVQGTVFLRLDFNELTGSSVSPNHSSFQSYQSVTSTSAAGPIAAVPYTVADTVATTGTVSIALANGVGTASTGTLSSVNRANPANSGAFTYGPVYQDFVKADGASTSTSGLWVTISGLRVDYQYDLTFYCYDYGAAGSSTVTLTNKSGVGTAAGNGTITYVGGTALTSNSQYARTVTATANASGQIKYLLTSTGAQASPVLNGLVIAQGPPIYTSPSNYPGYPAHAGTDQAVYWVAEDTQPNETVFLAGGFSPAAKTIRLATLNGATSAASATAGSSLTVPGTLMNSTGLTFVRPDSTLLPVGPFAFRIEDSGGLQLVGRANLPSIRWAQGIWSSLTSAVAPLHSTLFNSVERGGTLRLFGRDFPTTAYVRLTPTAGGAATTITVTSLNRYAIAVPISAAQATGDYTVQVGANAAFDATYGDAYAISVVAASTLTTSTVTISAGNLTTSGDNQPYLQNLLNTNLPAAGQIKVFSLPAGTYPIHGSLVLNARQYLKGVSAASTKLQGVSTAPPDAWISGSSYWGLLDIAVEAPLKKYIVASDTTLAGHITMVGTSIKAAGTLYGTDNTRRTVFVGGPDIVICDSTITGQKDLDLYFEKAVTAYCNNVTVNLGSGGVIYFQTSNNMVFENGTVTGIDPLASSGFSLSRTKLKGAYCDNQYIANTSISNIFGNNSESITQDGAGGAYTGKLSSASASSITLAHDPDWTTLNGVAGQGVVTIISGRGQGQSRTISGASGRVVDLATPWTLAPDTSSVVTLTGGQRNLIFYHNTMTDARCVVQLFGTAFDTTIADNVGINCAGIILRSRMQNAVLPTMNVDVVNNILSGNAAEENTEGLPKENTNGIHLLCSADGFLSNVLLRYNTYPPPADLSFDQTVTRTMNVFGEGNLGTTRAYTGHSTILLRNNLLVEDTFTAGFGGNTSAYPRWRTGAGTDISYSTTAVPDALQVTPSGSTTPDRLLLRPFTATTLGVGDTIRLTVDFYSVSGSGQFRFGLYNINGAITDGSAYGVSSPQTLKDGYCTFFSVATTGTATPIRREHEAGTSTGSPNANSFTVMAQSATGTSGSATYITDLATVTANVDFRGAANKAQAVLTITKNSTGNHTIKSQLYKGGVLTGYNLSATESDGLGYSTFNSIAFLLPAATVLENVRVEFTDVP